MNRRALLGASIGALVAALALPFERFAEWCKAWLGEPGLYALMPVRSGMSWSAALVTVGGFPDRTFSFWVRCP